MLLFTSSSHLFLGLPSDLVCAGELYKWFTVIHSKGKPMTQPVTIDYDPFNDKTKITDKCTCSESCNKKLPVGT